MPRGAERAARANEQKRLGAWEAELKGKRKAEMLNKTGPLRGCGGLKRRALRKGREAGGVEKACPRVAMRVGVEARRRRWAGAARA